MTPTLAGAVLAGAAASLHCAGMCGPLACGVGLRARSEGEKLVALCLYHGGRLSAYTVIGSLCGALGRQPLRWFFDSPAVLLPWVLVVVLVLIGTGLDRRLPKPAFLVRLAGRARLRAWRLPVPAGAGLTGLMTPFLPCGPLYAVFLTLMASGSAAAGAELALGFGLGTVPLLWLTQQGFQRWRARISPQVLPVFQRSLALITAAVLAWRLQGTLPVHHTLEAAQEKPLPSCCHE